MKRKSRKELGELLQMALQGNNISKEMSNEQVHEVFDIRMDLTGDGKRRIDGREVSVEEYEEWARQESMRCRQAGGRFWTVTLDL